MLSCTSTVGKPPMSARHTYHWHTTMWLLTRVIDGDLIWSTARLILLMDDQVSTLQPGDACSDHLFKSASLGLCDTPATTGPQKLGLICSTHRSGFLSFVACHLVHPIGICIITKLIQKTWVIVKEDKWDWVLFQETGVAIAHIRREETPGSSYCVECAVLNKEY